MSTKKCGFAREQQALQVAYFGKYLSDKAGHLGRDFQLRSEYRLHGLLPEVRSVAERLFSRDQLNVQFHSYIGHGRSSQACCINFLMPFADKPELLSRWLGQLLDIPSLQPLPIEKDVAGPHRYVAFEYTGPDDGDFLGEAGGAIPQRGAHATASDAAVAFIDARGARHLLLIEWKYTEEYRSHRLSADLGGKRNSRYADKLVEPAGPVRADLGVQLTDFLHEPFYQLLRQQMLAWQIASSSPAFDHVRVLHLSPSGNRALHEVTAPALRTIGGRAYDDAFAAFRACLVNPSDFIERSIETAFAPLADWTDVTWWPALAARYPTLCTPKDPA